MNASAQQQGRATEEPAHASEPQVHHITGQFHMDTGNRNQPGGRWDREVQGSLWPLRLPSVQTCPAGLWGRALHHPPGRDVMANAMEVGKT